MIAVSQESRLLMIPFCVFAGLDPAIHGASGAMDPRVEPAGGALLVDLHSVILGQKKAASFT
jgi:hypothetical protein